MPCHKFTVFSTTSSTEFGSFSPIRNTIGSLFPVGRGEAPVGDAADAVAVQGDDAGKDQDAAGYEPECEMLPHEHDPDQGCEQDFAHQEKPPFPAFAIVKPLVHQELSENGGDGDAREDRRVERGRWNSRGNDHVGEAYGGSHDAEKHENNHRPVGFPHFLDDGDRETGDDPGKQSECLSCKGPLDLDVEDDGDTRDRDQHADGFEFRDAFPEKDKRKNRGKGWK